MKKYTIIAAFAAALLLAGCAKEMPGGDDSLPAKTVLNATLSHLTRTEIDGVKVTWSAGDAINVNGTVSNALSEAGATGTFTFRKELSTPYKAVFPADLYKDATTVTLPATWAVDDFDLPLYGYAESGKDLPFKSLTALIKLSVTGESTTTLKEVTVKGLSEEQVSGDFSIDYTTGALAPLSDSEASKEVKVNVGKALSGEPVIIYIPVPAGTYASGYQIDLLDTEGGLMKNSVSARTLKAGELRIMPSLAFVPSTEPEENIGGIPDVAELKAFAAAVNNGLSIGRWLNDAGEVELLADLDLEGEEWTPIGNASVTTANAITGNAFTGVFNGGNHTVDNFKVTIPATDGGSVAGLFGAVQGATIKDLTIGSKVVLKTSSKTFATLGGVVGYAAESTLKNLDSYATLVNDGGADNVRLVIGGTVGTMYASASAPCTAENLQGHASFDVTNTVNTKNGGTGISVGGVIGFTDGESLEQAVQVTDCANHSSFSVQATRTGGVIGSMNDFTKAEGLVNNGNISCTDTKASNSRVAGIVSAMGNSTLLSNSTNQGDVVFAVADDKTHGYAAGIVGQTNDGNSVTVIDGCASYGSVLSDIWYGTDKYIGIICANFNSKTITVKNCVLGGKIGPYTPTAESPVVELTESNFSQYYSMATAKSQKVTFENNSFGGGSSSEKGIASADDLIAFAEAVNAGNSTEAWQNAEGTVTLLADIDLSGKNWTSIGNVSSAGNANNASSPTGNAFSGKFDGGNHTVKNFTADVTIADNGVYGLFGYVQDATIKNLSVEADLTLRAAATADAGVLAGTVAGSTIENVTVKATLTISGADVDNKRFSVGGIAGFVFGTPEAPALIKGCTVTATANVESGKNTKNGATCVHYGGIVGFSTTVSGTTAIACTLENCVNNGTITAKSGRSAGILAAANLATLIKNCVNNATHTNSFANARIAQIVCNLGNYSGVVGCTNNGDLTTTDAKTTTGGMVALFNGDESYLEGGTNTGTIITGFDPSTDGNNRNFSGIIGANINKFKHVKDFVVSGKYGHYKGADAPEMETITAENFRDYIGYRTEANDAKITGLTYVAP